MESTGLPTCKALLDHTTTNNTGGITVETLNIEKGYWRATATSQTILACYNEDACRGGVTGAEGFCDSGYAGPCKSVC